jgi:2,4-dienoyl-CoA reductase-like NADH-dependent reductase (Old Yellow Enzyme family)
MARHSSPPQAQLEQPLALPCGIILKNRLIKSAMSDSLGDGMGNPTETQIRLYERWAKGGAALSLIGEVQITPHFPEKPGNLVLVSDYDKAFMADLATRGAAMGTQIWPQLGHAGALAHLPISTPKGPSALNLDGVKCEEMTAEEIRVLPALYAKAAKRAQDAGFGGVQIHAGHGFLLSQFLSPLFNRRSDEYGGSIENRFRLIHSIINAIRDSVGADFAVGIRINSTDKVVGGLTEADALDAVRMIDNTSVDLIDISGGTYFPGTPSSSDSTAASGPYYIDFAKRAKQVTTIPVMLTGGIKTKEQANDVIKSGSADAVGLARAMILDVNLPNHWMSDNSQNPKFPAFDAPPPGGITAWYSMLLTAIANNKESAFNMTLRDALEIYDARDDIRSAQWLKRFQ